MATRLTLLLAMLLAAAGGALAAGPNLVTNPGLSGTAGGAAGWLQDTRQGTYRFSRETRGHVGSAALVIRSQVDDPSGWARWYSPLFLMEKGRYEVAVWCRCEGAATADAWMPDLFQVDCPARSPWTLLRARFIAARTGTTQIYLQAHGPGIVRFSQPVVRMVSAPPATPGEPIPAEGGAIRAIVIGPAPGPVEISAALDLQRVFSQVTGKRAAISPTPVPGRCLFIGAVPATDRARLRGLQPEGIHLRVGRDAVVCAGGGARGAYYAVQELLHHLGYAAIWPGTFGECLPPAGPLRLGSPLLIRHTPAFAMRGGTVVQVEARPGGKPGHVNVNEWVDWAARNRWNRLKASYATTWSSGDERGGEWEEMAGHTTTELLLPATLFGEHPEWFPLVKGKRIALHPIGTTAEPCVSNRAFRAHVVGIVREYFATHPHASRFFIGANDEPSYWCECPGCRALDPVPIDWRRNGKESLRMTDRWLTMVNEVASMVRREFPGRWVGTFAYASTTLPPARVRPASNVMIEWTAWRFCRKHRFTDRSCPVNREGMAALRAWMKVAPAVSIYSYLDYLLPETPQALLQSDADFYRTLHSLGVRHIADELDTTPGAAPQLLGYRARLMWDLAADPGAFLHRFCAAAYGPAARDMEAYWRHEEWTARHSPTPHPTQNDLARYTPAALDRGYELLSAAMDRPVTPDQRARIERARMSLLFAESYGAQARAAKGSSVAAAKVAQLKRAIRAISRQYGFPITLGAESALGGSYDLPMEAIQGKVLATLPLTWRFRTDPQDAGVTGQWYRKEADLAGWRDIQVTSNWEAQWVGAYDGAAWYTTEMTVPAAPGKRTWLLFGAVDETWQAWIDGVPVGHSTGEPGEIWDKPSACEITGKFPPGRPCRLTVRVNDIGNAGGIWKPVKVTASD